MRLRVQLFAVLRERAGASELVLDDLPEELDLAGLKRIVSERRPELGSLDHVAGVVGTEYAKDQRVLVEGDEVALLPPVSGGSSPELDTGLELGVFELCSSELDVGEALARVVHDGCGAVTSFVGTTREINRGQRVVRLEYEAFDAMTGPEMRRIFDDCRAKVGGDAERDSRMLCQHRVGVVEVGKPSVVIAVASPHRDAAFRACRFLIDELKARLPIWKKEIYADGHHWIGDRS